MTMMQDVSFKGEASSGEIGRSNNDARCLESTLTLTVTALAVPCFFYLLLSFTYYRPVERWKSYIVLT